MVFEKIRELIVDQFGADEQEISMETSFIDDLSADSLDVVELIMAIEEEFNIEVDDSQVEQIQTVGDVVNYLSEKI